MSNFLVRPDLFYVEFGKNFIPKEIEDKYTPYVHNMPCTVTSPRILVEGSLQTFLLPAFEYDPTENSGVDTLNNTSIKQNYRGVKNPQELSTKDLTLSFKILDGYINYWILFDAFMHHYDFKNKNRYIGDIVLRIMDHDGIIMFSRIFKDCLMTGMSDLTLNFATNQQLFNTFDLSIKYSTSEFEMYPSMKPFGNIIESITETYQTNQ